MADILSTVSTRRTPATERADARQVKNNAGGYVYKVSDETKVHRFLTLGTEGGTYYQTDKALTADNARTVLAAARDNGEWLVQRIVEVSVAGRAPKQNPAIFALAAVAGLGSDEARKAALAAIPQVCRIGTHLFLFATYVENFRGWGRGLRNAVGKWYTDRDLDGLAYQVTKYRQREGWSHRDLLRLAHPISADKDALFKWVTKGELSEGVPPLVHAHVEAMAAEDEATWVRLIAAHPMSWEMLPDAALKNANVWRALIQKGMPQTALMRNLPRFTNLGILKGDLLDVVCDQLRDSEKLKKGRIHPVAVLLAMKTYASGTSMRGSGTWTPVRQIVDALDAMFYLAYGAVEPSNKRTLLALDVSGSMMSSAGGTPLSCREASAALALVTMATEPSTECVGFTAEGGGWGSGHTILTRLSLSPRQRLDDAVRYVANLPFGRTDCSLPMVWAQKEKLEFDTFQVYTDNETWCGGIQPMQALREYRQTSGINARLAVVGMTATDFSISDPDDPGSLDVSGFDSNVPNMLADFSRGSI